MRIEGEIRRLKPAYPRPDGRTRPCRRFKALVRELMAGSKLSPSDKVKVLNAATLIVRAEFLRERFLAGDEIPDGELIRLIGTANRLLNGVVRSAKAKAVPAIVEYLKRKRSEAQ